jgi:hypothetical protein
LGALNGDRVAVVAIFLDNGRSVAFGVDVVGVDIGGWQCRVIKLRIANDDGFIFFDHRGGWWVELEEYLVSAEGAVQPL